MNTVLAQSLIPLLDIRQESKEQLDDIPEFYMSIMIIRREFVGIRIKVETGNENTQSEELV